MGELYSDGRYALRVLARNPGFAAIAVSTLALGIGASTAIFTIFDSVLLRPLPYREPGRLVAIQETVPKLAHVAPSFPVNAQHFLAWKKQAQSFENLALFGEFSTNLTSEGEPVRLPMARASASLFPLLGIAPQLGRTFREEEDQTGHDRVVILSDGLWNSRFHRDPGVIGRKIVLDGNPYEVIGVLPAGAQLPKVSQLQALAIHTEYAQLWKPFAVRKWELEPLGDFNFGCIARLKRGVAARQALAELNVIQARLIPTFPEKVEVWAAMTPLQEQITGRSRQSLQMLLAAVAVVLLIVCVNIANLLLARAAGRRRELAVRAAIGAPRWRLVRQVLTESLLLAALGGTLGILLARWGLRLLLLRAPLDVPRLGDARMDWRIAGLALLLSLASGLVFGILPAWRMARTDPQSALQSGGRGATEGRHGGQLRRFLIAMEVALSVMCLVTAGLLLHSFERLLRVDKGFQTEHAASVTLRLPNARYPKREQQSEFVRALLERVGAQPGVVAVGVSNWLPLEGEGNNNMVMPEGAHWPLAERPIADIRSANPEFFRAMGIPIVRGRGFREQDGREAGGGRRVAVISSVLAHRLWPGQNPVGRRLIEGTDENAPLEVIGVSGDVHGVSLQRAPNPTMYVPFWQRGFADVGLVVRTTTNPLGLSGAVRNEIHRLDPQLPVPPFQTLDEVVDRSLAQRRFQLDLILLFAGGALLLAALGVYGVVSHSVAQRTNEIGIRMAMGASIYDVWRMVLRQGMAPVLVGMAAGTAGALVCGRLMSGLLYGVGAADPWTFAVVAAVLLLATAAACYVPARRATRVDPLAALRWE